MITPNASSHPKNILPNTMGNVFSGDQQVGSEDNSVSNDLPVTTHVETTTQASSRPEAECKGSSEQFMPMSSVNDMMVMFQQALGSKNVAVEVSSWRNSPLHCLRACMYRAYKNTCRFYRTNVLLLKIPRLHLGIRAEYDVSFLIQELHFQFTLTCLRIFG